MLKIVWHDILFQNFIFIGDNSEIADASEVICAMGLTDRADWQFWNRTRPATKSQIALTEIHELFCFTDLWKSGTSRVDSCFTFIANAILMNLFPPVSEKP